MSLLGNIVGSVKGAITHPLDPFGAVKGWSAGNAQTTAKLGKKKLRALATQQDAKIADLQSQLDANGKVQPDPAPAPAGSSSLWVWLAVAAGIGLLLFLFRKDLKL